MALTKPTNAQLIDSVANFFATPGDDSSALGGADILGTSFDDIISGGTTNIESLASDGIDRMEGGLGDDTYIVRDTSDTVIELIGEGTDTIWTSVTYTLAAEVENIAANGANATTLTGNSKDNILDGAQATGTNTLIGGAGNDNYYIASGDKVKEAVGAGTDTVWSSILNFSIDLTNTSATGIGFDAATVGAIEKVVLLDGAGVANITGNGLNNNLSGNSATNSIFGGTGNDTLDTGSGGNDTLNGGDNNDTYIVRTTTVTYADSSGIDLVKGTVDIDISVAGATNIENVTLTNAALTATGNSLNNVLTGNAQDNTLMGGSGNDTLVGGDGINLLQGGAGNDAYIIVNSTDTITGELATVGETDNVQFGGVSGIFTMGANVENITLTGTADIGAIGNASNNTMTGNGGDNTLVGGLGVNTFRGGAGNDTYIIVNSTDTISGELATAGEIDTVEFGGVSGILTIGLNVENITLTGNANIGAIGNTSNNTMTGNSGNNTLNGGLGDDTMIGGMGDDAYFVDSVNDVVNETGGSGTDTVNSAVNFTLSSVLENLTLTGTGVINGVGNNNANILIGNSANNNLLGLSGNDNINAGNGNDSITGGVGKDTIITGTGNDTIFFAAGIADSAATASSIAGVDLYSDLQLAFGLADTIGLTVVAENVGAIVSSGILNQATFVSQMNSLLTTAAQGFVQFIGGIDASVVTATTGDLAGRSFLAVDLNSSDTFTATDLVIEITGSNFTSISTATFV